MKTKNDKGTPRKGSIVYMTAPGQPPTKLIVESASAKGGKTIAAFAKNPHQKVAFTKGGTLIASDSKLVPEGARVAKNFHEIGRRDIPKSERSKTNAIVSRAMNRLKKIAEKPAPTSPGQIAHYTNLIENVVARMKHA